MKGLLNRGFGSLLVAQFFGAANDNVLKGVLVFMVGATGAWPDVWGQGSQGYIALFLTVPFILLSGFAGQFADRHSKRRVIVLVKIVEVPIALVAMAGLWTRNFQVTVTAFTLLAIQSTFFGPAKYGVIPELVDDDNLSRANGILNMMTNIAVIVGTLVAGPVCDLYLPAPLEDGTRPPGLLWLPGAALFTIAAVGLAMSLLMPPLRPQDPTLRYVWNPFSTYVSAVREMARSPLLLVAITWAFFYLIGMMALLVLPEYKEVLGVTYTQASYLLGILGVSIGLGSVAAGLISGHRIEPRLVPIGALGLTVFTAGLGLIGPVYWLVAVLLFGTGFFAGFYIIPLQALLQHLSPNDERGRFLGTANAISFVASTIGGVFVIMARELLGLAPTRVFLLCAGLLAVGSAVLLWMMRRMIARPQLANEPPGTTPP